MPVKPTIAVSGGPGTGTTTLCKLLSDRWSLPHVYAGALFRAMAKERGLSLADFGAYAEKHPEVDRELDARLISVARAGGVVLEGRMSAWHVEQAAGDALTVLLVAPEDVRAERVANREHSNFAQVLEENRVREASEAKRYREIYGFDPTDPSKYDLVVDTGPLDPEGVYKVVSASLAERFRVGEPPWGRS